MTAPAGGAPKRSWKRCAAATSGSWPSRRPGIAEALGGPASAALAQVDENHLGDGLEGLEDAGPLRGDRLEDRLALAHELALHLLDRQGGREVALVELQHVRDGAQIVSLLLEIEVEV